MKQRELELLYRKLDGEKHEPRWIQPLHLQALGDALLLFALDPKRADGKVRRFVLSRMKEVRVTNREFERPKDFDPDELMKARGFDFGWKLRVASVPSLHSGTNLPGALLSRCPCQGA